MDENFLKKQDAFVLADTYSFFPTTKMRFEETQDFTTTSWGFFANHSNRMNIHMKFDSNILGQDE